MGFLRLRLSKSNKKINSKPKPKQTAKKCTDPAVVVEDKLTMDDTTSHSTDSSLSSDHAVVVEDTLTMDDTTSHSTESSLSSNHAVVVEDKLSMDDTTSHSTDSSLPSDPTTTSLDNSHHSSRSRIRNSRRVTFRDEELGRTPRHVVTQIHERPRTTEEDKSRLFYNSKEIAIFEQEELYERIEEEIKEVQRLQQAQEESGHEGEVIVKISEEMKMRNLVRVVERF
jgi:hypothetical protein